MVSNKDIEKGKFWHSKVIQQLEGYEQDLSVPGIHMIDGLLTSMDPGRNFNPGKIIAK
jgi:hypothetical protein